MDFNTFNYYLIIFVIFLTISIISFIINILYYNYKKKRYSLFRLKILIIFTFIILLVFLIIGIPFYITTNSKEVLQRIEMYILPIISYNFSTILFGISITLFIKALLEEDENLIRLNIPSRLDSRKGNIKIGRIMKGGAKKYKYFLSLKDLEKHMFICGATGTGKSNFLQSFLLNFTKKYSIPFFLVEFKGEYHFLQRKIDDLLILWPGENFSINIFNPGKISPIIHAERIFDILKSGKFLDEHSEFSPQMEKVLVEILTKVCKSKKYQNWKGFQEHCIKYLNENQNGIPMLKQTLISINNRIRRFSKGPLKVLFESEDGLEMNVLFERNVVLDLSSIIRLGGEKEDALFFLNMILKYMWDRNLSKGAQEYMGIKHITIIEDAQYFAPQDFNKKNKVTTYLEDIALLQRGTGECLITLATRPDISKEILANNGVVVTFKNHIEKEVMCELLNLEFESKNYLSILEEGQCILRDNTIKEPFLLSIPLIPRESLSREEIIHSNNNILSEKIDDLISENLMDLRGFSRKIKNFFKNIFIKIKKKRTDDFPLKNENYPGRNMKPPEGEYKNIEQKSEYNPEEIQILNVKTENKEIFNRIFSYKTIDLKETFIKFTKIQNLYKTNSIRQFLSESKQLVEDLAKKLSKVIGFECKGLGECIKKIKDLNLDKKLIIFEDIIAFRENFISFYDDLFWVKSERVKTIYFILKVLIRKLRNISGVKRDSFFNTGYENLKNEEKQTQKFLRSEALTKKVIPVDKRSETEKKAFKQLEAYIEELYSAQNRND